MRQNESWGAITAPTEVHSTRKGPKQLMHANEWVNASQFDIIRSV